MQHNSGVIAVFIDGNNLFHACKKEGIEIDYSKLLNILVRDNRLLRAFFYTGSNFAADRQQSFLMWMRRNGFRVVQKELKTFFDGSTKANLDVEIAVDMLSLAGYYDTAVLVSGDEDFVYAVNAVAYKGCRVEVAGFRSNTATKLIDVADHFIDLREIVPQISRNGVTKLRTEFLGESEHGRWYGPSFCPGPQDEQPVMDGCYFCGRPIIGLNGEHNHTMSEQEGIKGAKETRYSCVCLNC